MISIIVGTRPEIIKMSPIIRECQRQNVDFSLLHTGQHYSYEMDQIFFEELNLPFPDYQLDAGSGSHADQTGRIMCGIENVYEKERPDAVLVQGDTNTVLAGSLVAAKMGITLGHVEAGLRSYDRTMPEEVNRVVSDHLGDWLFAPTEKARENLLKEGIDDSKILVTGNTIVDAVFQNLEIARTRDNILQSLAVKPNEYFLVTAHRQENVDNPEKLQQILSALKTIREQWNIPVIFPVHPRTRKMIDQFQKPVSGIYLTDPIGFFSFLHLESKARLVLTDSGGVQEECCILGVPCVTLRENTERPETVDVGANTVVGTEPGRILEGVKRMLLMP
ncbi:MAG TPA: UDP-N-acetylglucosamine 2-epimerase (non-hydrolyzing), partial [Methanospirillum sp.]|uniref:non-hydrolyzing UDP-N-acetylglucosamine 2-epimerase n=1 Tax=Methanospirillum sp. TaxID=45200 RepID=UPI002CD3718C